MHVCGGKQHKSHDQGGWKIYHARFNGLDNHPDTADPLEFIIDDRDLLKRIDLGKHIIARRVENTWGGT